MAETLTVLDPVSVRQADAGSTLPRGLTIDRPETAWLRVAGELDFATAPKLRDALADACSKARVVVLDLRELVFMDTAGVHAIVDATVWARRTGSHLVALRGPPQVDRVFTLTRCADRVEIVDIDVGGSLATDRAACGPSARVRLGVIGRYDRARD